MGFQGGIRLVDIGEGEGDAVVFGNKMTNVGFLGFSSSAWPGVKGEFSHVREVTHEPSTGISCSFGREATPGLLIPTSAAIVIVLITFTGGGSQSQSTPRTIGGGHEEDP